MFVVRARVQRTFGHTVPVDSFWEARSGTWGRFGDATRYESSARGVAGFPGPPGEVDVAWVDDLPRDLDGWPYDPHDEFQPWRLTLCCAAATSISDGPLYCRSCFTEQPLDVDCPPRLGPDWRPGDGPVRIHLGEVPE